MSKCTSTSVHPMGEGKEAAIPSPEKSERGRGERVEGREEDEEDGGVGEGGNDNY